MEREYSHTITEQQYNYLLPVFGITAQGRARLLHRYISSQKRDCYFFIGTHEDFLDMLNRCKYLNNVQTNKSRAQRANTQPARLRALGS